MACLLQDLASGFMSGKLLQKLDTSAYILAHHTSDNFAFLDDPVNARNRTTFYHTLARLLFMDESASKFKSFVAPLQQVGSLRGALLDWTESPSTFAAIRGCRVCNLDLLFMLCNGSRLFWWPGLWVGCSQQVYHLVPATLLRPCSRLAVILGLVARLGRRIYIKALSCTLAPGAASFLASGSAACCALPLTWLFG